MNGRQRSVVARVHGLQHVQRLFAADLADDDAVGAHTQGVDEQLPLPDRALALDVRRPRFEACDVLLVQLKFRRVFDGDDALTLGDEARQHVEQRRLAGARASADQRIEAGAHAVLEELEHRPRQRPDGDEILGAQAFGRKTTDGEQRAVDGERRNDRVDTRTVRQAGVDHRRAVVDAAADAADDAVDDAHQVAIVLERRRQPIQLAGALDVDVLVGVDQDVADRRIAQQRLERTQAEHLVDDITEDGIAFAHAERHVLFGDEVEEQRADVGFGARPLGRRQRFEVQAVEQLAVDVRLELDVLRPRRLDARPSGSVALGRRRIERKREAHDRRVS